LYRFEDVARCWSRNHQLFLRPPIWRYRYSHSMGILPRSLASEN